MPSMPSLPLETSRRFSKVYVPQPIYLGLDIQFNRQKDLVEYCICTQDASYSVNSYLGDISLVEQKTEAEKLLFGEQQLINTIRRYADAQHFKIQTVGIGFQVDNDADDSDLLFKPPSLASKFWLELDAVPFIIHTTGSSLGVRACSALRKSTTWLSPQFPGNIPRINVKLRHEVEVALMRHALIRLFRLLNIDAHWYVAKPKPEVFDITKRKFHNVLQGVAPPDVRLTDADKVVFRKWSDENVNHYWNDAEGPLCTSDVIVIDDPQVSGIIPHIKRLAKSSTKIIYRSHIEIRADLIRQYPTGPQAETWHYLWDNFIRHADLFISHPVSNFVPDDLPLDKVVLMPATTDPLDGLNKAMEDRDILYYQLVFNRTCSDQGSREVDWRRPYIVQVARFDPSKDGAIIYEQAHKLVQSDRFTHINGDITVARLPPCDQLLNVVLRGAYVALQLSSREGFEVKVTEALSKGVPVIAFESGGIPLQIKHDFSGYLVPVGETGAVATLLFELFSNRDLRSRLSETAKNSVNEDYFTPVNAINWLFLCNKISENVNDGKGLDDAGSRRDSVRIGHGKWVKHLWYSV
ncbi:hypothetical protein BC937DRAFT_95675 [Endogone sp. FLAS-F59071]|nr:hypothetical protein BC937DRAFT_95675 [Endogone sp. FLAS-F59071]|eukprot:RUS20221.1 hypothetical protein BC937DRAFT_95675 [Endogone sp. FLAS-F59071]